MKETRQTSPFAALSRQEQQEKWLAWQTQQMDLRPVPHLAPAAPQAVKPLPALKLPTASKPAQLALQQEASMPPPRHSQYDEVLKRMKDASVKVTKWQTV